MSEESTQIDKITAVLEQLCSRIDRLESKSTVTQENSTAESAHGCNQETSESHVLNPSPADQHAAAVHDDVTGHVYDVGATGEASDTSDIQAEFAAIKEALQKVKLPSDLGLHESKQGIRREDQQALQILSKSARYAEVTLKLLGTLSEETFNTNDLKQLFSIQVAHIRYLQDEYATLVVQGKFNKQTSHLFRSLQKNTAGLSPSALANLKIAAEISNSAAAQGSPAPGSAGIYGTAGYQNHLRGRGRGGRRGFRRPGSGYQSPWAQGQAQDAFDYFPRRQWPSQRPPNSDEGHNS